MLKRFHHPFAEIGQDEKNRILGNAGHAAGSTDAVPFD
jgi:hypothetical protein